jgi:hypothetical protein
MVTTQTSSEDLFRSWYGTWMCFALMLVRVKYVQSTNTVLHCRDIQPHFLPLWLALDFIQQLAATLHMLHTRPEPLDHRKYALLLFINECNAVSLQGLA